MAGLISMWRMPFSQFWRMYLDGHRNPGTRMAHYLASVLGLTSTLVAIDQGHVGYMAGGIGLGYVIAILSHRLIEGNRALIRVNPFYGMVADVRMCFLAATGRLRAEYKRLDLGEPAPLGDAIAKPL